MTDTNHIEVLRGIRRVYIDPETIAALDAAITALSARASAGEGGPSCPAIDADKPTDPDSKRLAALADWMDILAPGRSLSARTYLLELSRRLAAPQPAQAGASGGDWICGFCKRTYTLDAICCDKQRVHRRTTPQPAAAQGGPAEKVLDEYVRICISEHDERATKEDRIDAMRRAIAAAPQPQTWSDEAMDRAITEYRKSAGTSTGLSIRPSDRDNMRAALASLSLQQVATPPAHGDGEGDDPFGDMPAPIGNPEAWPPNYADGYNDAVRNMVDSFPSVRARLTTHPTPEAQEARDAVNEGHADSCARYEWLREHFIFANDSMHELWFDASIKSPSQAHELDAAIDAARAVPAQGEGES